MVEFGIILGVIVAFWILLVIILLFVFWIWMIIDCAQRRFKRDTDKIVWILVIILLQIVGALIYYFVVKRNG